MKPIRKTNSLTDYYLIYLKTFELYIAFRKNIIYLKHMSNFGCRGTFSCSLLKGGGEGPLLQFLKYKCSMQICCVVKLDSEAIPEEQLQLQIEPLPSPASNSPKRKASGGSSSSRKNSASSRSGSEVSKKTNK